MFLVNTIEFLADEMPGWQQILFAVIPMAFLFTVWMLGWKLSNTNNPDLKFACKAGLYGCYILFAGAMFILVIPIPVGNLVDAGEISLGDASLYTAGIISITFVIWNVIGLVAAIIWHCAKRRKEMSEMDRMKLEDL